MKNYDIEVTGKYANILTLYTVKTDLSKMSADEFAELMISAVKNAQAEYSNIIKEYNIEREKRFRKNYEDNLWRRYKPVLDAYKREYARQNKIKQIEKEISKFKYFPSDDRIFFDTMPICYDGCVPTYTIIDSDTSVESFKKIYNDHKKLIEMSTGIVFKYEITGTDQLQTYAFRPWFEFIIPANVRKELQAEHNKKMENIAKFYDSLNYKGD